MAFVGKAVPSAFIKTLFDMLASPQLLNFASPELVHADINKWKKTPSKIYVVLDDAEEKQMTNPLVDIWLGNLRDLAYDVEDFLDEFTTEALPRELKAKPQVCTSEVGSLIPSCCTSFTLSALKFNLKMRSKIKKITTRLQDISAQKEDPCLTENIAGGGLTE